LTSTSFSQTSAAESGDAHERVRLIADVRKKMEGMPLSKLRALGLVADELVEMDVGVEPAVIGDEAVKPHPDYETMIALKAAGSYALERLGNRHGVFDLAQDNGIRTLETMLLMNMLVVDGRNGNDLMDVDGREVEFKTLNLDVAKDFSSHRQLNHKRIDNYSDVAWIFSFYTGARMTATYIVHPIVFTQKFEEWRKLCGSDDESKNNPKIPSSLVVRYGTRVWGKAPYLKGWKKVDKLERRADEDVATREGVTSIELALALSRQRYEQYPPACQIELPLDLPVADSPSGKVKKRRGD
jgi:hypothetical protein